MDLDIPRKEVHVCPIQNSKYKKKSSFCPQPKGKPVYTLHRQGGRRSCSQLLSRLQRHTQANVALNLSVWKSFCIASRFFFHSNPVTSIMNLNLALWYVLGGCASQEAGRDQRIRWTCIKILLAFKGWRSNPHLLKYFNDSSIWAEYYLPVPIIRRWSNCNFLFDMDLVVCCGNAVRRMSDKNICGICTNTIVAASRSL